MAGYQPTTAPVRRHPRRRRKGSGFLLAFLANEGVPPQAGAVLALSRHAMGPWQCHVGTRRQGGRKDGRGCRWCIAMNVPSERRRSLCNVETNMHSLSFSLTLSSSRKDGGEAGCQTDRHRHHPSDRRTDQPGIGRARYVFQASGHRILELCPPTRSRVDLPTDLRVRF